MSNARLGNLLLPSPTDGITATKFSQLSDFLLVSSWDGILRIYNTINGNLALEKRTNVPILDCCFKDDMTSFSGCLDGKVLSDNLSSDYNPAIVGIHHKPVKCVQYLQDQGLLASGGWDCILNFWDPRMYTNSKAIYSVSLPGRAYTIDNTSMELIIGTSHKHILIFDLRNLHAGPMVKKSPLRHQTRIIRCFANGSGYGIGSTEGRVAIEYFDPAQDILKYAFRCHRKKEGEVEIIYPVNALSFHPEYGTFATGGCDGSVCIWDGNNKKKLSSIQGYPCSISYLDFSRNGQLLAIASSYTFEEGDRGQMPEAIYVRNVHESEVKPKMKQLNNSENKIENSL